MRIACLTVALALAAVSCKSDRASSMEHHDEAPSAASRPAAPAEEPSKTATTTTTTSEARPASAPTSFASRPPAGTVARCTVSDEVFTVAEGTLHSEHAGRHYVFCCEECKPTFDGNPDKFAGK